MPVTDRRATVDPAPDPYINKAIVSLVGFAIVFVGQWLASKGITLEQEGLTAIGGLITTLLVYLVSNRKKLV